ncbi:MAG: DNA-protecting protein DprA [Ruminococcaceae bacterium]|nr:DNA-protecting protein DprA [Oscillospiraceae bacterium]
MFQRMVMLDKEIWLWLSLHFGAGTPIYRKLYSHFGSLEALYDCDDADVDTIDWLANHQKKKILDKNLDHAREVISWCDYYGVNIVTPSDKEYPYPLRELEDYPAVLYYRGTLPDFENELCISVVGTRSLTMEGQRNAYNLGYGLAKGGAIVVSGMAKGIDGVAQKGALYAGGSSVAVLGSGIDVIYPKENAALMEKLMRVGVVMTEYPPHTPPSGTNFPIRNRIISGLSVATVVVEADINSGSLITAKCALKQGRDLFAFPGPVNSYASKGTNRLISDGAKVATEAIDILENYMDSYTGINLSASKQKPDLSRANRVASNNFSQDSFYSNIKSAYSESIKQTKTKKENPAVFDVGLLNEKEKMVYDNMEFNKPTSLDSISKIDLQVSELASILTMLEIKGAIESAPGGFYIKK